MYLVTEHDNDKYKVACYKVFPKQSTTPSQVVKKTNKSSFHTMVVCGNKQWKIQSVKTMSLYVKWRF